MMNSVERQELVELLNQEVIPALGCTEPVSVALATARSKEELTGIPDKVEVFVSGNIYKNGMGVGIPGTGMTGLPIATALGAICGQSVNGLNILEGISDQELSLAKEMIEEGRISIKVKEDVDNLYVEATCYHGSDQAQTIITHRHTNIIYVKHNDQVVFSQLEATESEQPEEPGVELSLEKIYDFATTAPIEELTFILKGVELNLAISNEGLKGSYGLQTGKTIAKNVERRIIADDIASYATSITSAASDARMDGCTMPVMTNCGSGNQGITTFLPVVAVATKTGVAEEKLIRALILSNLSAIYIKRYVGQLTALCGILISACGAACGITYLLGGELNEVSYAIKNMAGGITGMICDGAKQGCALKVSSGASTAVYTALLAIEGISIKETDGIIDKDVDKTVRNIGLLASKGMLETDRLILETMISK